MDKSCQTCRYFENPDWEKPCSECFDVDSEYANWTPPGEPSEKPIATIKKTEDNVNHPSHYESSCSLECIEAMEIIFGIQYVYSFCICNAWKYIWRHKNKNGLEDLKKARWYIDRAKWYERNYTDEVFCPERTLKAMDEWLLGHNVV